jgi:P27 family predicted phage terminase small subunit
MGLRGPIAKDRTDAQLGGNAGKRPLPKAKMRSQDPVPPCPSWLSQYAKDYWSNVVPILEADGTVSGREWSALVNMAQAFAEFRMATETIEKEGRYYTGPNGCICVHPAVKIQMAASKTLNQFMTLFGLQPTTKGRLPSVVDEADQDQEGYSEFRNG